MTQKNVVAFPNRDWTPMNPELWSGRLEAQGARYFQRVKQYEWQRNDPNASREIDHAQPNPTDSASIVLMGFACDEGVRRNQGRVGAQAGPNAFRKQLAKLPFRLPVPFCDAGNITCEQGDLEASQAALRNALGQCLGHNRLTLLVGGGHEIAWGHYLGLADFCREQNKRLGIINFDAHFDLRQRVNGQGNSGTPFLQIAEETLNHSEPFRYLCLGVQPMSNHDELFSRAKNLGAQWIDAFSLQDRSVETEAKNLAIVNEFICNVDAIYLTICLDVFHQSVAPGVSAPQALGIFPETFLRFAKCIAASGKVLSFDIAELNPLVESLAGNATGPASETTARLAAALAATLLEWVWAARR